MAGAKMEFRNCEPVIRIRDTKGQRHRGKKGKEFKNRKLKVGSDNGEVKSTKSDIGIRKSVKLTKREHSIVDKSRVQILLHLYEISNIL